MNPFSTFRRLSGFSPVVTNRDGTRTDSTRRRTRQYFFHCSFLRSRTHALCRLRALAPPDAKVHAYLCVQRARADIFSPRVVARARARTLSLLLPRV